MDLVVEPASQLGVAEAARLASAQAGIELQLHATSGRGAWWRAGVADAVARAPGSSEPPASYDAALSPRSTRGATRA